MFYIKDIYVLHKRYISFYNFVRKTYSIYNDKTKGNGCNF